MAQPKPDRTDDPPEDAVEGALGLDMVLVDAARGPLRRLVPPAGTTLRFGAALARNPSILAKRAGELAGELGRITVGRSDLAPGKKDKRFADPAWTENALLRRAVQTHLATARTAWELIEDADLEWRDDERIRFTATNVVDALAPSNVPLLNPQALKAVIDTGGKSVVRGVRRMVESGSPCADVLIQLAAVRAAVDKVARVVLEDHLESCLRQAATNGKTDDEWTSLKEALDRFIS